MAGGVGGAGGGGGGGLGSVGGLGSIASSPSMDIGASVESSAAAAPPAGNAAVDTGFDPGPAVSDTPGFDAIEAWQPLPPPEE